MFDWPLDLFSFAITIAAFVVALRAFNRADHLRARLDALEAAQARSAVGPVPPPLQEPEATLTAPSPVPVAEPPPIFAETASPAAASEATTAETVTGSASTPPPLPPQQPAFEERIGTRWVVWIGGLTLALGGFFLVRYSI